MAEYLVEEGIERVSIEDQMKSAYMEYAMSVIVSRALPDVRDGLKPVHRRILYAQHELSNSWNRAYKKSARIVGDVMGKYHPHGDQAIYDTLVRMAQPFSMRLLLEDGQGNFGSIDGDKAAAMRYTEVRMARASAAMLQDIEKDTVDFEPNYDGHDMEPTVLPARFPNLLVNGTAGIAVGMATNIPPHNLNEVVDASLHLVDNPHASTEEICEFIQGPDFPTGGIVLGKAGMKSALETGRGSVVVRGKTEFEEDKNGRWSIVVHEIPFQVNKAKLVERIAELVKEKEVEGISEIRDESDRDGMRIVIELKRDAHKEVVLSQLLKHTSLQSSFSYNMLALDGGRPRLMGVREVLECFLTHREEVIRRRTRFDLNKARARAHILVGLATAVANIDDIIKIVRHAPNPAEAKLQLTGKTWPVETVKPLIELLGEVIEDNGEYRMSDVQAQAILELRLHRLTGLERDKINEEADEIAATIRELVEILSNRMRLLEILKEELIAVKEQFGDERRSSIEEGSSDVDMEDLIKPEEMVVTVSTDGYVKRQPMSDYRAQRRGGKGKSAANMKNEDEQIQDFFIANTHSPLLFFTSVGKVYKLKVYELPQASSGARGKAFVNLLPLERDEKVMRVVRIPRNQEDWEGNVLFFATQQGLIRKTPLTAFNNVYATGIKGISLNEGDTLVNVLLASENDGDILMNSSNGQAVRFPNESLRTIASRTAYGVKGMTLKDGDTIVSTDVVKEGSDLPYILTVTENGFGKRTACEDFPTKSRGTMGVIAIKTTERNGKVVASLPVADGDHIMIATARGQVIRMRTDDVSVIGRNTQGVTMFKTDGDTVISVSRIPADVVAQEEADPNAEDTDAVGDIDGEEGLSAEVVAEAPETTDAESTPEA